MSYLSCAVGENTLGSLSSARSRTMVTNVAIPDPSLARLPAMLRVPTS
jgi:hypothetical protein